MDWGADSEQHNLLWAELEPSLFGKWLWVYDPRVSTHVFSNPATWAFSDNPALCVAHTLTNWWKRPLPETAIDWPSVAEAAEDCDRLVLTQGLYKKIFRLAGVIDSAVPLAGQITEMLSAFGGSITYVNGKYSIHTDKYRMPEITLTDDDLLGIDSVTLDSDNANVFNAIKGVYKSADSSGRTTTTRVIELLAEQATEGVRQTSLNLPFTPDDHSAQILAYRHMLYSRDGRTAVFRFTDVAIDIKPPNTFTLQSDTYSWLSGDYQVIQLDLAGEGVLITARRVVTDAYADESLYVV
jgi:hypothetical protein